MSFLPILLIAAGVLAVSYGANILVDGASSIAARLKIPDIVIGLTIVSFGTSAPELIVSTVAAWEGNPDIAVGNVIGSNIGNILLILGISAWIAPLTFHYNTVWKEIPFSVVAIAAAYCMISDEWLDGGSRSAITRSEGLVLLLFFAIYLYYMHSVAKSSKETSLEMEPPEKGRAAWLSGLMVVGGIALLTLGGRLIVDNATLIARAFGVSDALIGLTLVAVGTSIPELATSIVAAVKGNSDIAIGNVVGSNIFNIFFILGVSSLITPLPKAGVGDIDFMVCGVASLALFGSTFIFQRMRIHRWEGGFFLLGYIAYTIFLLLRG